MRGPVAEFARIQAQPRSPASVGPGQRYLYCIWPGLAHLWLQGSWSALGMAVSFALVLNLAVASTLVWTELLESWVRAAAWLLAGIMWTGSAVTSFRWLNSLETHQTDASADAWYVSGVQEYLQGHWFEAETTFSRLVRRNDRDVDARLMLAALFRHTGRHGEARGQLDQLDRLSGAEKWRQEIRRELELLADAEGQKPELLRNDEQQSSTDLNEAA